MTKRLKQEDAEKIAKNQNLILLDKFINTSTKMRVTDSDGYIYYMPLNSVKAGFRRKYHPSNPYTLHNIEIYLKSKNASIKCLEEKYIGYDKQMKWQCSCGSIFYNNWDAIVHNQIYKCQECRGVHSNVPHTQEEVSNCLANRGYKLLSKYINLKTPIEFEDENGYKY